MRTLILLVICCMPADTSFGFGEPESVSAGADAALLAQHQVEPTAKDVTTYLRRLGTDPADEAAARRLIGQLADDDFHVREAATRSLIDMPFVPLKQLQAATTSSDPEVAFRAKSVLADARVKERLADTDRGLRLTAAVLRTIRDKPIQGVTSAILKAIPLLEGDEALQAAYDATAATAGPDDVALLRKHIGDSNVQVRIAAIRGLGRAAGKRATEELRSLTGKSDQRIAFAAARALAEQADRAALPALIRLCTAADQEVRIRSVQVLRALTGRSFSLDPFQEPHLQQKQIAKWNAWLAAEGRTAELRVPLRLQFFTEHLRRGLLLHYTFDRDVEGKLTDVSGHKRHGSLHNEYRYVKRGAGKALHLTGQGEDGDRGGHALLPFIDFASLKEFSIAVGVNEQSMSSKFGEAYVVFGSDRQTTVADSVGISHFNQDVYYRVGDGWSVIGFDNGDLNRWTHYALTFRNQRLRAYRNGRLVDERQARVSTVGRQAALGRHWWHHGGMSSTRFVGAFDEVRVYDRALSEAEIRFLTQSLISVAEE